MRIKLLIFALFIANAVSNAQTRTYEVSAITKDLLPYASSVIRESDFVTEVKDFNNTIFRISRVITVLNKNGDDDAHIVVWHNKSNQIRYIKGIVYDEYGKQTAKFNESNFQDASVASDASLFEDSRVKHYQPAITSYPYTVAYEYEVRSRQSLNLRDWEPIPGYGMALENSTCTFICKPDFKIRYKQFNYPGTTVKGTNPDGNSTYTWKINHQKAIKSEPYSPAKEQYLPMVKFAPEKFSYEGHTGSFTNWNELGKWVYTDLLSSRTALPPETVAQMKELVKGVTDAKEKAKKVYEYMQQKTRYISVQIGIGGYQPFLASDVDRLSYGDCKALVNYTQALLKAVDVPSYYCVVQAGSFKESLMPDFASMEQGNHVILCLPLKNDTTWLECTSKHIPFGYLGAFTDDREVLACTSEGGKLLHTPKYAAADNRQTCAAKFIVNDEGALDGELKTTYEGTQYDNREGFAEEAYTDQVTSIREDYHVDNMEIEKLGFKQEKMQSPVSQEQLKLKATGFAAKDADKLYFYVNATHRIKTSPREVRNRSTQVYINRGFTDADEIAYTVPAGFKLESEPLSVALSKPFGTYTASLQQQGNQLLYKRKIQVKDGTYNKEMYQDLVNFYQSVVDADGYKVIMVKK